MIGCRIETLPFETCHKFQESTFKDKMEYCDSDEDLEGVCLDENLRQMLKEHEEEKAREYRKVSREFKRAKVENQRRLKEANEKLGYSSSRSNNNNNNYDFGDDPYYSDNDKVPEAFVSGICCLVCGDVEGEDEMVVCELVLTQGCKSAFHVKCLPSLAEMTNRQFICDECLEKRCCVSCKLCTPEQIIMCGFCHSVLHPSCLDLSSDGVFEEDWLCPNCICRVCGKQGMPILECDKCLVNVHPKCDTEYDHETGVCSNCKTKPPCKDDKPDDFHDDDEQSCDEAIHDDSAEEDDDLDPNDDFLGDFSLKRNLAEGEKSSVENAITNLLKLKLDPKMTFKYLALKWFVEGFKLNGKHVDQLLETISIAFKSDTLEAVKSIRMPAQNLARSLRRVAPPGILKTELIVQENDFVFKAWFQHRPLLQSILQLYTSSVNRARMMFSSVTDKHCDMNRQHGTRLGDFVKAFRQKRGLDKEDILFLLRFWSDGTNTKFSRLHPMILSLANFDTDGRARNPKTAFSLVGMAPVRDGLQCTNKNNEPIPLNNAIAAQVNINKVLKKMLRASYKVLFDELRDLEDGVKVNIGGKSTTIRAALYSLNCDLDERQQIYDLDHARFWFCPHCYLFHGHLEEEEEENEGQNEELLPATISNGNPIQISDDELRKRSLAMDRRIRQMVKHTDPTYSEKGVSSSSHHHHPQESLKWFGLKPNCDSPFVTGSNSARIFLLNNSASDNSKIDILHNLAGVRARLYRVIKTLVGKKFVVKSQELGNKTIDTPNSMTYYKFEEQLFDFQFVALALSLSSAPKNIDKTFYSVLVDSAFQFLEIVTIVKDEAAGKLVSRFSEVQRSFKTSLKKIDVEYQKICPGKTVMSCKLHELLEHVDLKRDGCLREYSTLEGESMLPIVKEGLKSGSMRKQDQSTSALEHFYWRSLMQEVDFSSETVDQNHGGTCYHADQIRFVSPICDNVLDRVVSNVNLIFPMLRIPLPSGHKDAIIDYLQTTLQNVIASNTIEANVVCELHREVERKSLKVSVPLRTNQSRLYGVSFRKSTDLDDRGICTSSPKRPCKNHNPKCEIKASFAWSSTCDYGIPILFFEYVVPKEQVMLVLRFTTDSNWKYDSIVKRFTGDCELVMVELSRLRDRCLVVSIGKGDVYVFRSGSNVFDEI
jgi:hypothetical protein